MNCSRCEKPKPLKDFSPDAKTSTGKSSWCKACKAEYQRDYKRARRATPEGHAAILKSARSSRVAFYGLTDADYEEILALQGGVCAGCKRPPKEGRRLDIDHKHQPGEKKRQPWERASMVRGLLCHMCNRALGILRDKPEVLRALLQYLESPPAVAVLLPKFQNLTAYLEAYEVRRPN